MKEILRVVAGIFGVAILLSFFAASVSADPTITISIVHPPPNMLAIPIRDLDEVQLCDSNQGNCSELILINLSRVDFTDFHITVKPPQPFPITGRGDGVFQNAHGTESSIDFSVGRSSSGISVGDFFSIKTSGFSKDTVFFGNATASIPEPTTMLLLGTGLAGIAAAVHYGRYKI